MEWPQKSTRAQDPRRRATDDADNTDQNQEEQPHDERRKDTIQIKRNGHKKAHRAQRKTADEDRGVGLKQTSVRLLVLNRAFNLR
jgi:hypothetical protein